MSALTATSVDWHEVWKSSSSRFDKVCHILGWNLDRAIADRTVNIESHALKVRTEAWWGNWLARSLSNGMPAEEALTEYQFGIAA